MYILSLFLSIRLPFFFFFFFNDTATTEIYTLSLHDALPIWANALHNVELPLIYAGLPGKERRAQAARALERVDRKSTRLNSSHGYISYAVFCLKKKKNTYTHMYANVCQSINM